MFKALKSLAWMTQLGVSIVAPLVLCILGSRWLQTRFSLGRWIVAAGVLLGVGGAVSALWSSLKMMHREADSMEEKKTISFNDHQ